MFRRLTYILGALALLGATVAIILTQVLQVPLSFPAHLWAKIPASVGDKPAPIPILITDQVKFSNEKAVSSSQVRQAIASSVGGQGITAQYSLKEYELSWQVTVEDGSLAPVKAQVFVPIASGNQKFPVIIYGPGSTGLDDRCAPSREDLRRGNMGNYHNYMIAEAAQGYIVVMPNYEGFDNLNRPQHYFNKDSEARSMLSAAQATLIGAPQINLPNQPEAVFLGGYSQGGHAAFAAADYASTYSPDLKIAGIFGHGPTTDIFSLLKNNPNLAAYFVASYSDYYPAIKPEIILEKEWVGYLDRARRICVNEGFGINSTTVAKTYADPFEKALMSNTLSLTFPEINAVFVENSAGTSYTGIPTMIVHGTGDPIVPNNAQEAFVTQLCQRGISVDLKEYAGVHHFNTRQVSFRDTNEWIKAVSQGQATSNSCLTR